MEGISTLPTSTNELQMLVIKQQKQLRQAKIEISNLDDLVRSLRGLNFAPKSEVVPSEQLGLFNELEDIIENEDEVEKETISYERKKRGKRKKIPDHFPRVEKIVDLTDEEKKMYSRRHRA